MTQMMQMMSGGNGGKGNGGGMTDMMQMMGQMGGGKGTKGNGGFGGGNSWDNSASGNSWEPPAKRLCTNLGSQADPPGSARVQVRGFDFGTTDEQLWGHMAQAG